MLRTVACAALLVVSITSAAHAQSGVSTADQRYFDFWLGRWHRVDAGVRDPQPSFIVTQGVNQSTFEESWQLRGDKGETLVSRGMRAWDTATNRWMFAWVSAEGLFQLWEGRKVGADWYIYREFEQQGRRFWSRQTWIPQDSTHLVRVMERSFDGGATWEPRSRTTFEKVP